MIMRAAARPAPSAAPQPGGQLALDGGDGGLAPGSHLGVGEGAVGGLQAGAVGQAAVPVGQARAAVILRCAPRHIGQRARLQAFGQFQTFVNFIQW